MVAEKETKIFQNEGSTDDKEASYELRVDAHEICKNYDVIEAIEENFDGTLNDMKIGALDPSRHIRIQKIKEEPFDIDKKRKNWVYKVNFKENKAAKTLVESWKHQNKFDDLAFRHACYDKVQIRIKLISLV